MPSHPKRALWLLNHRTLLATEPTIISDLGYEVFIPKVLPNDRVDFRSTRVEFSFDAGLTIPDDDLQALNNFSFYTERWPEHITEIINAHFDVVFVVAYTPLLEEVFAKFKGKIFFRVFGTESTQTYTNVLRILFGEPIFDLVSKVQDRFWFAQAYPDLGDVEGPLLSKRALYLPLSLPDSFYERQDTWRGGDNRILFVCPNINDIPYYRTIYDKFKQQFGDLPHVIIGEQQTPVDDENVLGFVSDDQFLELLQTVSAIYYHSLEPRHLHYTPVEAAVVGTPVVFYSDSLLGRISGPCLGSSITSAEARAWMETLLPQSRDVVRLVQSEQLGIAESFKFETCKAVWAKNFAPI
jgi:hypothetical protein